MVSDTTLNFQRLTEIIWIDGPSPCVQSLSSVLVDCQQRRVFQSELGGMCQQVL